MTQERTITTLSGFLGLLLIVVVLPASAVACFMNAPPEVRGQVPNVPLILFGILLVLCAVLCIHGLFVVAPNDAKVLVLFGRYVGTVKENGFYFTNPFTSKKPLSLKARTLDVHKLKVNDKAGNPIEIAAVVVWQIRDTYAALFQVEAFAEFVALQSETALRKLTSSYHYDGEEHEDTLRGATQIVSEHLRDEIAERLQRAGIDVIEARISHLAYAPEIAHAMLQRQQASAVIAARSKIVEGAVGMVEMALQHLSERQVVELDTERRAAMVSNLLVVLVGDRTTPVINTGTLYT